MIFPPPSSATTWQIVRSMAQSTSLSLGFAKGRCAEGWAETRRKAPFVVACAPSSCQSEFGRTDPRCYR